MLSTIPNPYEARLLCTGEESNLRCFDEEQLSWILFALHRLASKTQCRGASSYLILHATSELSEVQEAHQLDSNMIIFSQVAVLMEQSFITEQNHPRARPWMVIRCCWSTAVSPASDFSLHIHFTIVNIALTISSSFQAAQWGTVCYIKHACVKVCISSMFYLSTVNAEP